MNDEKPTDSTNLALIGQQLNYMSKDIGEMKADIKEIKSLYVTREKHEDDIHSVRSEMEPLKKLVFGAVGLVLTLVLSAIVGFVLVRH